jgi:hypothetical protein
MNGSSPFGARRVQDRMTAAIARLDADAAPPDPADTPGGTPAPGG